MTTIRDVARACGVSPMTVSFVLNNKPGQVSEETRERVLKAMRDLDYRPAALKSRARERQILTLGLVAGRGQVSLMQPGYYAYIVDGFLKAADQLRHNVTLFTHSIFPADPHESLRVYCDGRCDGLMVLAPNHGSQLVAALHERGTPFVLIGDTGDTENVSCVDIDNIEVGYHVTEYLIRQGHRRIAFVGGPEQFVRSPNQRYEGYCRALIAHGLVPDPAIAFINNNKEEEVLQRLADRICGPASQRPTAFFGWNDGYAARVMRTVQSMGLRVPEDVSIIGVDDDVIAQTALPPLTTMRQPYEEISRKAVEILVAQIRGEATTPQRVFMPTEFVLRRFSRVRKRGEWTS